MNFTMNNVDDPAKFSSLISSTSNGSFRSNPRRPKPFEDIQILEICCLILILFEHTFIFLITFRRESLKKIPR